MVSDFAGLRVAAHDPQRLASFWAGLLGLTTTEYDGRPSLLVSDGPTWRMWFVPTQHEKTLQNRIHFDLTSASADDQERLVETALRLGGRHVDIGQGPDDAHVVLGDPEGNEFCVIPPGNRFLAGTGVVGAINCDGTYELGRFWSRALGWPLVWDHEEETAIQSPAGGSKLTWSGTPLMPRDAVERFAFELVAADPPAEADRLRTLGAVPLHGGDSDGEGRVVLADPDGNEFAVAPDRTVG